MDMPMIDYEVSPEKKIKHTVEDVFALPGKKRAELINGVIFDMATPSRLHQEIVMGLSSDIHSYIKKNGGKCRVYPAPFGVYLEKDKYNWFEPDITVVCDPKKLTDRGCDGAPDVVIEIASPSTEKKDYMLKFNKYFELGVREYWIINPMNKKTIQYWLEKFPKKEKWDDDDEEMEGESESAFGNYTFEEEIPFYIYPDLRVRIADYLE